MLRMALAVVIALAGAARADEGPPTDADRLLVSARIAALGVTYLVLEFPLNDTLSPARCRWCYPDGFDAGARNLLKWNDTRLARGLGNATGYVMVPVVASGFLAVAGWPRGWRRAFDDISPVIEAAIVASLLQHVTKLGAARQRPDVHYAAPGTRAPDDDDNVSFWSGHSSLTFALAVSAGSVATIRGYSVAPAIWATTLGLAVATGYLRIAGDRHYATDVLMGAAVGTIVGYVWPHYVRRHIHPDVTPTGVAVSGSF